MSKFTKLIYLGSTKNIPLKSLLALTAYDILIISLWLIVRPPILAWLFDDRFVAKNGLLHYVDFRPGYPPLGKLPYTLLYTIFNSAEGILLYNIITLNVALIILYKLLKGMTNQRRARILTLATALYPPLIWATIYSPHADIPALIWLLLSIYFTKNENPIGVGVSCGLGFLTKVYNAILLLPAFMLFKGWGRMVLLISFLATLFAVSAPFLALDPLMYVSTYAHHLFRGPSESLFALLDGYYSHTGFPHPTYEAAIYAWQFALVYTPSNLDHFRYAWNYPQLRYVSFALQTVFLLLFSLMVVRTPRERALKVALLALLSFFAFSAFWNPIISIPFFILSALITLDAKIAHQIFVLMGFVMVDSLHYMVWFPGLPLGTHLGLLVVVASRAILTSIALYVATGGRGDKP
jgi:hypothetical protein